MINLQEIEKAATDFVVSNIDRNGLVVKLCKATDGCYRNHKKCAEGCPLPTTVGTYFTSPVISRIRQVFRCLPIQNPNPQI